MTNLFDVNDLQPNSLSIRRFTFHSIHILIVYFQYFLTLFMTLFLVFNTFSLILCDFLILRCLIFPDQNEFRRKTLLFLIFPFFSNVDLFVIKTTHSLLKLFRRNIFFTFFQVIKNRIIYLNFNIFLILTTRRM